MIKDSYSIKLFFGGEQYKKILDIEFKLVKRDKELKGVCEICEVKQSNDEKDSMRSLPDGRQVCKQCWNIVTDETLIKNANNHMHG